MRNRIIGLARQFMSFGLVGGINTVLNLVIYCFCVNIGVHYLIANTISFLITVFISYVLNNLFTFRTEGQKPEWCFQVLIKVYTFYFLTGMILNSLLLYFWNDFIGINQNLSPILNLFVTVPLNFILNKLWAYKDKD